MDERREDWRNGVDQELVNLTTAQRTIDGELEDIHIEIADLQRLLQGDEEEQKAGLIERIHDLERIANTLRATVLPDYTGKGGFAWRLDELESKRDERMNSTSARLKFWGTVAFAAFLVFREIVHDLPDLEMWWRKPPVDVIQRDIDTIENPKPRHRHHHAQIKKVEAQPPRKRDALDDAVEEMPSLIDGDGNDPK